ncbi:MAG: hypothetical protein OHK0029_07430 [Armatimonadaceae bacterium]
MSALFSENPVYKRYEELLFLLDDLDALGENDSDRAEDIRTEMDLLYRKLTHSERERLRGLSADLFMLRDEEISVEPPDGETRKAIAADMQAAWQNQDMEILLDCLRKASTFLSREAVASLRAYAYQKLGHLSVAYFFKRFAAELNPQRIEHRVGLMELLWQLGDWEMASMEARLLRTSVAATTEMQEAASLVL